MNVKEGAKAIRNQASKDVLKNSTRRPWSADPSESGETIYMGSSDQNAACVPGYADHPHNMANAELIVRAVNSYEPMLAALNAALNWYTPPNDSGEFPAKQIADAIDKARSR